MPGRGHEQMRTRDLGTVSSAELQRAVASLDEAAWTEKQYRQEMFNVHSSTQSIVLCFIDLDGVAVHRR